MKTVKRLEDRIAFLQNEVDFYRRCLERSEKRRKALVDGIRVVHPADKGFMMAFKTEDKDLFDVYNEFLYSFGRPDGNGVVFTRLSS